ncbi:uncharacterized protein PG998_000757 [Apiospora kogelbergensis]|uniref:uncharacterized protein n=1 Tax=Apiospora kogelbergensis TaxID=1337665 RepID=UPI0031304EA6
MNYEQPVPAKLSNPSECMEGYQEPTEPGTPTSVASSTRYRDLPTWPAEINEQDFHSVKLLQSFEQDFEDESDPAQPLRRI